MWEICENNSKYYKRQESETLVFYGATKLPKLELHKIINTLKELLNQDFITQMKLLDVA